MMRRILLFIGALAFTLQANAQAWVDDSVAMGPGYGNDVFYSMKNGSQKVEPNTNWHIAFQMTPQGPYGNVSVIANHVQGGVNVYSLHVRATTNFASVGPTDTIGKTSATMALYNTDSSWNFGAFNVNRNLADITDYGWGIYHQTPNHDVDGDSVYLVTVATGPTTMDAYKLWIQRYHSSPLDSTNWLFRIAKLDGTGDTTIKLYRSPLYTSRLFAYYNVATRTVLDREPDRYTWDVLFTRYKEYLVGAPGVPYYSVMGLLSNFDVTVSDHRHAGIDDTAGYQGFTYNTRLNEIGSDWKVFNMSTFQYVLDDSTYYFVKTKNTQEYWQLKFTGFGGAGTGKVVFKKRLLGPVINSISTMTTPLAAYYLAPNPATNNVSILLDSKETVNSAKIIVTDLMGRIAYSRSVNINNGLNAYQVNTGSLAAGTYLVTVSNGSWKATEKLVVQH